MSPSLKKVSILVAAVAFVALALQAFVVAEHSQKNSDTVLTYLEALDMASGNALLSGWHVPKHSYFLTDTLPSLGYVVLFGPSVQALDVIPVATLVCLAAFAGFLTSRDGQGRVAQLAGGASVFVLIVAVPDVKQISVLPGNHVGGVLLGLAAMALVARLLRKWPQRRLVPSALGLFVLSAALVFNDQFSIVYAISPIIGALIIEGLFIASRMAAVWLGALVAAGCVAGTLLPRAAEAMGGFSARSDLVMSFANSTDMIANAKAIIYGVAQISGANPFTQAHGGWSSLGVIARMLIFVAMGVVFVASGPRALISRSKASFLDRALIGGVACVVAAAAVSSMFSLALAGAAPHDPAATVRYLFPGWVCLVIFAGRHLPAWLAARGSFTRPFAWIATGVFAAMLLSHFTLVAGLRGQPRWNQSSVLLPVADWLHERGLTHGGAEYWASHMLTVVSDGRVTARPIAPDGPKIALMKNLTNENWDVSHPEFVVWPAGGEADRAAVRSLMTAAYGEPAEVTLVAGYDVAVFPRHP